MDAVTVRMLTSGDWAQLKAARLAALADAPDAFASTLAREEQFADDLWRDRAGAGRTFGGWQNDALVGLVTGFPLEDADGWHLVGMWVAPRVRGQGLADRLVRAICDLARASDSATMTLWVTDGNDRARAFYQRLGFTPTGSRQKLERAPAAPDLWEDEMALALR